MEAFYNFAKFHPEKVICNLKFCPNVIASSHPLKKQDRYKNMLFHRKKSWYHQQIASILIHFLIFLLSSDLWKDSGYVF